VKQASFEQAYEAEWLALEQTVGLLEAGKQRPDSEQLDRFAERYRRLVRQHALAVDRHYSAGLIDRLQQLLQRSHHQLYRQRELLLSQILYFLAVGFPSALRRQARYFWLATALFYVPALAMGAWCYVQSDAIYSVMDTASVAGLEYAYDPSTEHPGRGAERQSSTNFEMLGFYVWNNTSIGFRSFASGLTFGIGTVFITVFNGVMIGAAAGHLSGLGFNEIFWPFVSGHGAFELTAICISAAAGLMLGAALLLPGRRRRVDALRLAAMRAVPLVTGAALFFFIAAFVEAFWSPADLPAGIKFGVAALLWASVAAYLSLAGRGRDAA